MDDIQKQVDDKAWDKKQDRWVSDANRRIEEGVGGDADDDRDLSTKV